MTRILHFADLHLDRSFAGLGMASAEADKRRWELRDALRRIVDLAIERQCDVITIGGDLYEHDRVTLDTGNFLVEQFRRFPGRVFVAPGNHDPYKPDALYRHMNWPTNVHIFQSMAWQAVEIDGVTLWGVGHTGPAIRDNLLGELRSDPNSASVALLHGSDMRAVPEGKPAHAPFEPEDVDACGARFVLLGHYHRMRVWPDAEPRCGYPGSPEPLDFGEQGTHYVLEVNIGSASLRVEPLKVNVVSYRTERLDVGSMSSSDEVREAIVRLAGEGGQTEEVIRVVLEGQVEPEIEVNATSLLNVTAEHFRYLDIVDQTAAAFDLATLREEPTTRGSFVSKMLERIESAPTDVERTRFRNALRYGLQSFAGLEVRPR